MTHAATPISDAPGPVGHRFSGNLPEFWGDPLGFLLDCHREFGDIVRLGARNLLVAHPEFVADVLVNRHGAFAKPGAVAGRSSARGSGFPQAMMNSQGEDWRQKRERLQPLFAGSEVAAFGPAVIERTRSLVQSWRDGDVRDTRRDMSALALDLIVAFLFGRVAGKGASAVDKAVAAVMDITATPFAFPRWVPTPTNLRLRRANRELAAFIHELVGDGRASRSSLLAALSEYAETESYVHDETATLLMSGHETTADALSWMWHLLSRSPRVQERMRQEATSETIASCAESGDSSHLPYTSAVVREALRLFPPAWITNREVVGEVVLGSYQVPNGMTVAVSQWVSHRDRRFFKDPGGFRPERWLEDGKAAPRFAFFPFGGGRRVCIGARLAMQEMVLIAATICRSHTLESVPESQVVPRPALALQPSGLRLRVRRRGS